MAITPIKKTCLAYRQATVHTISLRTDIRVALAGFFPAAAEALPPVWQKNLLKLAFPAPKFRRGGDFNRPLISLYIAENQLYITTKTGRLFNLSGLGQASTDFEFNKPILKNRPPILKDFEKNSTDFERF